MPMRQPDNSNAAAPPDRVGARTQAALSSCADPACAPNTVTPSNVSPATHLQLVRPPKITADPPTIAILGAALDTGNLGVQALGVSLLAGLARRCQHARFIVFESRTGCHHRNVCVREGDTARSIHYTGVGCSLSRRPLKPGNLYREHTLHRLGFGERSGMVSRALAQADLILDITGGDSFTTLYGPYRFRYAMWPKSFALRFRAPFVLLPQTYGPFDDAVLPSVRTVLNGAAGIWARDTRSASIARSLAPHQPIGLCPDLAFLLPDAPADAPTAPAARAARVIGVNVSGLLANPANEVTESRYQLRLPYRELMQKIVTTLLEADPDARVRLIPHVVVDDDHPECDGRAARVLWEQLEPALRERCDVLPNPPSATVARAWIGDCDFFVGTRMHSCIAALSQGIPTCAIAYSDKTHGVFSTVGVDGAVIDPRDQLTWPTIDAAVSAITHHYHHRDHIANQLATWLPDARKQIADLYDELASLAQASGEAPSQERRAA